MKQQTRIGIYLTIISAVILTVLFGLKLTVSSYQCSQRAVSFDDSEFKVFAGCMVKRNGKWIPLENIRGFGDSD